MRLALDTNTYRALAESDRKALELVQRAEAVGMPVPVLGELRAGFLGGTKALQNEATLLKFLDSPRVHVLACDEQTTHFYGELKSQLRKQGTPIPINDVWIAALVLQHRMRLFSFDRDFDRLPQLARA